MLPFGEKGPSPRHCFDIEDFDQLRPWAEFPAGWLPFGGGSANWVVGSGGGSHSGDNYLLCETQNLLSLATVFVRTPSYPGAALSGRSLHFALERVSRNPGTLEVRMDDGTGAFASVLATYSGRAPGGQSWTLEQVPLPANLPAAVQFRFDDAGGPGADLAIDSFCIR